MNLRIILTRRKRYVLSMIVSFFSGIMAGYLLSKITVLSSIATWIGGSLTFVWVFDLFYGALKEARQEEEDQRKKGIDNLKKHTEDLIPELRKWTENPLLSSQKPLFLCAQQHIKGTELREILEGKDGIRALESQKISLTAISKQIQTSIKNQHKEKIRKFEVENLEWFVQDIIDDIEEVIKGHETHPFEVEKDATQDVWLIQRYRTDGMQSRSPYYTKGTKDDMDNLAGIMNSTLNDTQIRKTIEDRNYIEERFNKTRGLFAEKMNLIIDTVTYGVSDEDRILFGQCDWCEDIKRKLKLN
jgi:hypothetical protein